jgi:HEAT repeat protein
VSTGRTLPTGVGAPILLESLKITGRVRPLQVIHRFQALLWAAGGLFWAWGDQALPFLTDAAGDEQWRVRGWVAKIIGKHGLIAAAPLLDRLQDDSVPRVRTAAQKASIVLADLR